MEDVKLIPLSALQHYAFCPRQCALIHNEQVWADNYLTTQGNQLHQRIDYGKPESRKGVRYERSVKVCAEKLGLTGILDMVEKDLSSGQLTPVEYKRGKSKSANFDKIQICAQALCLEEMTNQKIAAGYLWYWQTRRREIVEMEHLLRQQTMEVINKVKSIFQDCKLPKPVYEKKCKACSLIDICNPQLVANDTSGGYITKLFNPKWSDL